MISDVVIIGSELDAFIASLRLKEFGLSSRIISNGKGSYLFSSGNIKVLGFANNKRDKLILNPFESIEELSDLHPYKLIGKQNVEESIDWFFKLNICKELNYSHKKNNSYTISPIGLKIPTYGSYFNQLSFESIQNSNVSIVHFNDQRDFHSQLIAQSLKKYVNTIEIVYVAPPDLKQHLDNSALAVSFDRLHNIDDYFLEIKKHINTKSSIVIFPAVLGINKYKEVIESAEGILLKKCFEAPTLPPSIPSIRLNRLLEKEVLQYSYIYRGSNVVKAQLKENKCLSVFDNFGRNIKGKVFIFANGGIMMGGLIVDSKGNITEKIVGAKVHQINPMECNKSYESLIALQLSGVLTDQNLKPFSNGNNQLENVFFTGRSLSHWNPSLEFSSDGVSIATGWHSANNARSYLEQ